MESGAGNLQEWILPVVATYGYWGIFFMIALENVFPPIPSEVILTFGGFMTAVTSMNLVGVSTAATAGSLAGALVLYALGRGLGKERLYHFIIRRTALLHITRKDLDRATGWFERYQGKTVFACRMIPLVRSLISIPAGIGAMPVGRFCLLTALGSLIWNTLLIAAGAFLGENWNSILGYLGVYSKVIVGLLAVLTVLCLLYLVGRRRWLQTK